jgi:serine/threonine protein kinase
MSLQLVVVAGPDKGKTFTLNVGPNLMLGRSTQAQYVLSDPRVSRNHCRILLQGDEIHLHCNSSSSDTLVNGKKIREHNLKPGDLIQVGDTQLRLVVGDLPLDVALAQSAGACAGPSEAAAGKIQRLETLVGATLSHYDIALLVGKGHTGLVFHATDTKDNRPVALKVLHPEFSQDEEEMQRFVRAMKTVLPLRHPNLVTLYAAGRTGPYCWMAMEYVAGENLQQVIDRIGVAGMLDWRHAFQIAWQIGQVLDYASEQGILHRNVTPTNILRDATNKTVKLGDLMLSKALEGPLARQVTRPGELVGDVAYMSPERTRDTSSLDVRSDLYGLGATVYALLTGQPPVTGTTLVEKIARIRQTEPARPKKFQLSIPGPFEDVVMQLLAKQPEQRYQTPRNLIADLQRIARLLGVSVAAPTAGG